MSLTKELLFSQPEYQPIETNIQKARADVRGAIIQLESIENINEVDFELLLGIAHRLRDADATLETALNQQQTTTY